jgi:hypothetical protein
LQGRFTGSGDHAENVGLLHDQRVFAGRTRSARRTIFQTGYGRPLSHRAPRLHRPDVFGRSHGVDPSLASLDLRLEYQTSRQCPSFALAPNAVNRPRPRARQQAYRPWKTGGPRAVRQEPVAVSSRMVSSRASLTRTAAGSRAHSLLTESSPCGADPKQSRRPFSIWARHIGRAGQEPADPPSARTSPRWGAKLIQAKTSRRPTVKCSACCAHRRLSCREMITPEYRRPNDATPSD